MAEEKQGLLYFPRTEKVRLDQMQTVHEYLAANRILFLYGPVYSFPQRGDQFGPSYIADMIIAANKNSTDPIWLIIDSEGGSVQDGLTLYDAMKTSNCPIYTVCRSAYSIATLILAAGESDHRFVLPHARVMMHPPSGRFEGDAREARIHVEEITFAERTIADLLIECGVKKTREALLADTEREKWLNAEETVAYGIADKIGTKEVLNMAGLSQRI